MDSVFPFLEDSGTMVLNSQSGSYYHPESFGLYMASKRTHKRFLRENHLGKFKKKRKK